MKNKLFSILLLLTLILTSCASKAPINETETNSVAETNATVEEVSSELTISSMKGPTGMSLAPLKEEGYNISIKGSIEEQMAAIQKDEADVFLIPSNLYAKLQNKSGNLKLLAPNVGMALSLVGQHEINSVEELKGKTIALTGQGAMPEVILRTLLKSFNMEDEVNLNFVKDPTEAVPMLIKDENSFALLPEPFATAVLSKNENLLKVIDLKEIWKEKELPNIITSVIVAKSDVYESKKDDIDAFVTDYQNKIVDFVNSPLSSTNVNYGKAIEELDIIKAPIAIKSIPSIEFLGDVNNYKEDLKAFLEYVLELNPELIGGKVPDME
ncbi:ABC transporter substrate-binding protein [Mediannikoviicoccus vaginalis]|uniref:ABC transporter substrate-binding protein n=1 Tax=Mediannikoviicoccus vaginalis TaxID=2899727 RepID=UPI001F3EB445|nr:MqnA/MqnD/SBP family protein [Mediannikoviicoccus vaginalis]